MKKLLFTLVALMAAHAAVANSGVPIVPIPPVPANVVAPVELPVHEGGQKAVKPAVAVVERAEQAVPERAVEAVKPPGKRLRKRTIARAAKPVHRAEAAPAPKVHKATKPVLKAKAVKTPKRGRGKRAPKARGK